MNMTDIIALVDQRIPDDKSLRALLYALKYAELMAATEVANEQS